MTKSFTMAAVAEALGGKLVGDGAYLVSYVAHPAASSAGPGALVLATDKVLMPLLEAKGAQAAIVAAGSVLPGCVKAAVEVGRSRYAIAKLTNLFAEPAPVAPGVHSLAVVEDSAKLGKNVAIGAFSYVAADAEIGDGCIIHPQVYVGPGAKIGPDGLFYPGVRIGAGVEVGARAILHFNASIGADGFSFVTPEMGSVETAKATGSVGQSSNTHLARIASLGAVFLGDDVEVGANSSIDRGTIISTRVGNGTKIDNQVQIGHNVQIGENCMLCGRVGIAGSAEIGNRVVIGGASGVADHVKIGDDSVCMAMCGIAGNIAPRSLVGGVPAKPRDKMIQDIFNLNRVKGLIEKVKKLTERVDELEKKPAP